MSHRVYGPGSHLLSTDFRLSGHLTAHLVSPVADSLCIFVLFSLEESGNMLTLR